MCLLLLMKVMKVVSYIYNVFEYVPLENFSVLNNTCREGYGYNDVKENNIRKKLMAWNGRMIRIRDWCSFEELYKHIARILHEQ